MAGRPVPGRGTTLIAVVASILCTLLSGCGESEDTGGRPEREQQSDGPTSPFTGLPGTPGPVLAVKIDNVAPARPQAGLQAADIVYVEQVEAGQSRILAVFSSRLPERIGPVRSARESDIELLRQFGRPALAYSGAQTRLRPVLGRAPFPTVPQTEAPDAYVRDDSRRAPHNLYLQPQRLLAAAERVSDASDIGFRFGPPPDGGTPTDRRTVRYPAARFTFTWSAAQHTWLVSMDGRAARTPEGKRLGVPTVVIQQVTIRESDFRDRSGSVSPYTETVGAGEAVVLRDGKAYDARWRRDGPDDGTRFTTPSGERMTFARGPVWTLLTGD